MIASENIDLGLEIPNGFVLEALFPGDRLLRLHPNWFVSEFKKENNAFSARLKDYATEESFALTGGMDFGDTAESLLTIRLEAPIDADICFSAQNQSLFVQIRSKEKIALTDPLLLWIKAIKEYIRIYTKNTLVTLLFRLLMNRMILEMNPSQRKICMMLFRFTIIEILVIVLIVAGYVLFVL